MEFLGFKRVQGAELSHYQEEGQFCTLDLLRAEEFYFTVIHCKFPDGIFSSSTRGQKETWPAILLGDCGQVAHSYYLAFYSGHQRS